MTTSFENKDIENLAAMIARGFDEVDKRFQSVEQRLDRVDQRLDSHDQRFAEMDRRFTMLEQKMDAGFKSVREDINALASDHFPRSAQKHVLQRIERIEDHIGLPHELATA